MSSSVLTYADTQILIVPVYLLICQLGIKNNSRGVTGGVYKTRERIHRDILIRDY